MARLRIGVVLLLGLAVLALAAAGCGGGGASLVAAPTTLQGLADSAQRSADSSSGRFEYSLEMSMPGFGSFGFDGKGAFDTAAGKSEMQLDLSSFFDLMKGMADAFGAETDGSLGDLDPADFKLDAVLDGTVMYMRFPFLADKIPGGKEWVKIDLQQAAAKVPGLDLDQITQFTQNGPQSTLAFLKAVSGPIETIGAEELRGVATTHYRTAIDVRKYSKLVPESQRAQADSMLDQLVRQTGVATIPVDVWVGADGLVRKLVLTMSMASPGSAQSADATMAFELYDYGEPVVITLPLPEDTADVTALAHP
jgi:hypothetical protein